MLDVGKAFKRIFPVRHRCTHAAQKCRNASGGSKEGYLFNRAGQTVVETSRAPSPRNRASILGVVRTYVHSLSSSQLSSKSTARVQVLVVVVLSNDLNYHRSPYFYESLVSTIHCQQYPRSSAQEPHVLLEPTCYPNNVHTRLPPPAVGAMLLRTAPRRARRPPR